MATMTIRTTVAFDPATASRLERLARRWGVSKSEALRRALEKAEGEAVRSGPPRDEELTDEAIAGMTPLEAFDWLQAHPTVPPGQGETWRQELRAQREIDAQIDEEREVEHQRRSLPQGR